MMKTFNLTQEIDINMQDSQVTSHLLYKALFAFIVSGLLTCILQRYYVGPTTSLLKKSLLYKPLIQVHFDFLLFSY